MLRIGMTRTRFEEEKFVTMLWGHFETTSVFFNRNPSSVRLRINLRVRGPASFFGAPATSNEIGFNS